MYSNKYHIIIYCVLTITSTYHSVLNINSIAVGYSVIVYQCTNSILGFKYLIIVI